MLSTTLNKLYTADIDSDTLLQIKYFLRKDKPDDCEISFKYLLSILEFIEVLPLLRASNGHDKEFLEFSLWCSSLIEHLDYTGWIKRCNYLIGKYINNEVELYVIKNFIKCKSDKMQIQHVPSIAIWTWGSLPLHIDCSTSVHYIVSHLLRFYPYYGNIAKEEFIRRYCN